VVPIGAIAVWFLVIKGNYISVERILLFACLIYFSYMISAFMAKPDWSDVARNTFIPTVKLESQWLYLAVAIIGTTITPWMQFYLQASIAEKGINKESYGASRVEVIIGCIITDIVSFFIIVACGAVLFPHGIRITDASEAAIALEPLAGRYASLLFGLALANASLLGVIVIPLATAYFICEAMGWERGISKSFSEAPQFMWIYTIMIFFGAFLVLLPKAPLVELLVASSVINGVVLPFVLIYSLSLINNKKIMGEYTNSKVYNYIAWGTVLVIIVLSTGTVIATFAGS
jgi:Mn2+/Fe2+ NRAMP family transporter